jgi:hypothetical protein
MPTFEITSPEGKAYTVDGPDGTTPQQAYAVLQKYLAGGGLGATKQTNATPELPDAPWIKKTADDLPDAPWIKNAPNGVPPGYVLDKPKGNYFDQFDPKGNYFDQFDGKEASPQKKTIAVTAPNGATVEFPEGTDYATINSVMAQNFHPGPPPGYVLDKPQGSTLGGIAKSVVTGLVNGALAIAGLPAELAHLYAPDQNDPNPLGIAGLQAKAAPYLHTPQGALEETAAKIGEFAPAVIGGPETLGARIATRAVAPAVASEAAGKLTEGTPLQPWAEAAGALAGGIGAPAAMSKLAELGAARAASKTLPTIEDLKSAARTGYKSPDVAAVAIKPQAVDNLATTMENDLLQNGFRAKNQASAFNVIDELKNPPGPVRVADLDSARKALGTIAGEVDGVGKPTANAVAARQAIGHIDDFLPNLSQSDLIAGDAQKANAVLSEARQNWAAAKRAEQGQTLLGNAELNAASAHSGGNLQNSIKQAFKPLAKNNYAKAAGYNDEERAALDKVVRGTFAGNAARLTGNILGGGGGLGMLASGAAGYGVGSEEGGPVGGVAGALAAGLAGRGLKAIGTRSTMNAVKQLDQLLRSRSPEALKLAASMPPAVIQRLPRKSAAILAASQLGAAVRQQQQEGR